MPLWKSQEDAVTKLQNGNILAGGVGSGKSRAAIAYWRRKTTERDLVIITTAMKRDSLEWVKDLAAMGEYHDGVKDHISVDSWNNIKKYEDVDGAFFIFDEQKVVGAGAWVKSFLKITKRNPWILLSGTPGDTWMDYVPVFIANGFYRNRTDFYNQHVIFSRFTKYPKVERYVGERKLEALRRKILVPMETKKNTIRHIWPIECEYDKEVYDDGTKRRWNTFTDEPLKDAGALCYFQRRVVNSSEDRYQKTLELAKTDPRIIIFYSFDYELEQLRRLEHDLHRPLFERNGHKHERPDDDLEEWIYLVNYMSGSEAWNCITSRTIIFYSQTYSWKIREQAMGRIDRANNVFINLFYYEMVSSSSIDNGISHCIHNKWMFNERAYAQMEGF